MKILHYSLGFPPYRSGGLTTFCIDLMHAEKAQKHEVFLLWPGEMKLLARGVSIKDRGLNEGVRSYELINPLPVSFDEGITDIGAFTKAGDMEVYCRFLAKLKPDVIHIHTLMGLHLEFVAAAHAMGIRTVFTTHDFFPICPKVTMFREGASCSSAESCIDCVSCNRTALSTRKIFLLQSPLYRTLKDSPMVQMLRKRHRDAYLNGESAPKKTDPISAPSEQAGASVLSDLPEVSALTASDYQRLRSYYGRFFKLFDVVHFNSSLTEKIYRHFFEIKAGRRISISHSNIRDRRERRSAGDVIRFTYLGAQSAAKGYGLLREAMAILREKRSDCILNVYFEPTEPADYIVSHPRYSYDKLPEVFANTDVLVVPSIWNETFGFTALEALSFGVPVLMTDHVGALDIAPEGGYICVGTLKAEELAAGLAACTKDRIEEMNRVICEKADIKTMEQMTEELITACYRA